MLEKEDERFKMDYILMIIFFSQITRMPFAIAVYIAVFLEMYVSFLIHIEYKKIQYLI